MTAQVSENLCPESSPAVFCPRCERMAERTHLTKGPENEPCCMECADLLFFTAEHAPEAHTQETSVTCPTCHGRGHAGSEYHYVLGHGIRNECLRCDGSGRVSKSHALVSL